MNGDLEPRVRALEGSVARMEQKLSNFGDLPEMLATIRERLAGLATQTKITWALLVLLMASVIGTAVVLMYGGTP